MRITHKHQTGAVVAAALALLPAAPAAASNEFTATIRPVPAAYARQMTGVTWRQGCPVPISDLRIIRMTYWGFDHRSHRGELMVHHDVSRQVVGAFRKLYTSHFPIRRMELVERYRGSDDRSMAADNTSAFNCRPVTGTRDRFSVHAYGRAIDINPQENPYVKGTTVLPPAGRRHLDRTRPRPGLILRGDATVRAFAAAGMTWGGNYTSLKDHQHFERV